MELRDFVGAMRRRWYLVVLAALVVFASTVLVLGRVGPTYEAEASVVLMPPLGNKVISENEYSRGNPLFYLGGLSQSRDILIDRLSDGDIEQEVEDAAGPDAKFSLDGDPSSGAPILVVTGEAPTADAARAAALAVRNLVPAELDDLQSSLDIPEEARVRSVELTADDEATTVRKTQIRVTLLVAGLISALSLLLIGLLDGFVLSHRPDRPADRSPDPLADDTATAAAPAPAAPAATGPPATVPQKSGPPRNGAQKTGPRAPVDQARARTNNRQGGKRPPAKGASGRTSR